MKHDMKPKKLSRIFMLNVRVNGEQKELIEDAAEREGLQVSSFIIMLLVRLHILPDSCLKKLKRRPVPFFNALHGLLGVVNKIGGNCKQLSATRPDTVGLKSAHAAIQRAAAAISDALHGKSIPVGVNLYELEADLTKQGYIFNKIVKSVNRGRPELSGLRANLASICRIAGIITSAFTGQRATHADTAYVKDLAELAMEEMRANMGKAEEQNVKKPKG